MKSSIILATALSLGMVSNCQGESTMHVNLRVVEADERKSVTSFCWKDSYGRGIGKVPESCPAGQTRIGLLCYPNCPTGYARFGFDCHSVCPAGFRDDGLFCRKAEYGRGAGYPWKLGDGFNDNGMYSRCEANEGRGNCEKYGAIVYPKCRPGYYNVGCCICRPSVPDCNALGLNNGIDLSCAKRIIIGEPSVGVCAANEDRDAGLCYPKCNSGYTGVGPVCWGGNPPGWVNCGMGAARNSGDCASAVVDQVVSVGEIALFVASLGTSTSAQGLKAPAKASELKKLKDAWDKVKNMEQVKKAKEAYDLANAAKTTYTNINDLMSQDSITTEDYIRMAASMTAILDPTGVSSVIAAYTYPKCNKVVG